jgi:DNA-binding transcriptional regulator YdaS (Cro superfamily)
MDIRDIIKAGGGCSALAKALGLHHTTVLGWLHVPPRHVREVARLTGLPLHQLRPDLYDAPSEAA